MKLKTELDGIKPIYKILFPVFFVLLITIGWIVNLRPQSVSDINVQLSLFAMEKGYQGVIRMNSGDRDYTAIDYINRILVSPKNLRNASIKPLDTIYIEIPFDEQTKLNNAIMTSINFNQSNEREDINLKGQIRESFEKTINIEINLKGNGLDHIIYKGKESLKIEIQDSQYNNMSEFSLQHPLVRDFQLEPLFMYVTDSYGIISTELKLVNLNINGKNHGIFEIEEVGTKEHLEKSGKLNSVVLRFEAPRYRGLIGGDISASGRAVTYRTAMFDTLNTRKVNQNSELIDYKIKAKGKFRAYLEGRVKASEVFDPKLMGSYLAISEIFGAIHPLIFHNFLFYYNPDTELFEPIAYDASLHQRYTHSSKVTNITDGFVEELLYDDEIFRHYSITVYDLSKKLLEGSLIEELKALEDSWYEILVREFWLLEKINYDEFLIRPKNFIEKNQESLSSTSSRKYSKESYKNPVCSEMPLLDYSKSQLNDNKINDYELVKSEFFISNSCAILKIWSTAFDQPEKFKDIKLIGIEVSSGSDNIFYNLQKDLNLENSSMVNSGFPKIPKYQLFAIPNTEITEIKVFYLDPLSEKIVFMVADEIINY